MVDEVLRTFIAVELDEVLLHDLAALQNRFKKQTPMGSVKWVAPAGMHLTLKFLGDTPSERVPEIVAALQRACAGFSPFDLTLEGRGCFPNFHKPRVIWVSVREPGHALSRLQRAIEEYVAPLGWPTEARGFSPHLTLGRVSRNVDPDTIAAVGRAAENSIVEEVGAQHVDRVYLIRSDLRPTGAVYKTLAEAPLRSTQGAQH